MHGNSVTKKRAQACAREESADIHCVGVRDVVCECNGPLWPCASEMIDEVSERHAVAHGLLVDMEDAVDLGDEMVSGLALVHDAHHVPEGGYANECDMISNAE